MHQTLKAMKSHLLKTSAALALLLVTSLSLAQTRSTEAASPAAAEGGFHFAPVNQHSLELTAAYWNPILDYISAKSGVRLNLRLGRTSAETTATVLAGQADFAFTNHLFSPDRTKLGWTVFGRRNAPPVSGQIIVPSNSPIKTLADLADKDVSAPGAEALVAYKVTFAHLHEKKIPAKPIFAGNLDAAFMQMISGRSVAMSTNSQMVSEYSARENKTFRVLWSSAPFNDLALMASPRVPAAQVQAVGAAFFGMHRDPVGQKILESAAQVVKAKDPVSFVPATQADYAAYRDFYLSAPAAFR